MAKERDDDLQQPSWHPLEKRTPPDREILEKSIKHTDLSEYPGGAAEGVYQPEMSGQPQPPPPDDEE